MTGEDKLIQGFFNQQRVVLPLDEFQAAVKGLIQIGLMEEVMQNGMKMYMPTLILFKMKLHINSKPETRN